MARANDMGRLREEMQAGQSDRTEFVAGMARGVAELRRANQSANKERQRTVGAMLAGFHDALKRMAQESQAARVEFVTNLTRTVAELRKANQAENAAAYAAWHGARATGAVSAKRGGKWFGRAAAE